MEIRRSGKLAVGIIAAMGTIGALHLMVFKDRASNFQAARDSYKSVEQQYAQQGNPPDINEIARFRYETQKYRLDFWQRLLELNVALTPAHYIQDDGTIDVMAQRQRFWDLLHELENRREAGRNGQGPELAFLDERIEVPGTVIAGWNLVDSLPEEIEQGQIATEDLLTNLRNEDRLLANIPQNEDPYSLYQQRLGQLYQMLARLGLNVNERTFLAERYGPVFSTLYTLNRIEQVMEDLPENYWVDLGMTNAQARERMYEIFRIEWPKDSFGNTNYLPADRQGEALIEILDTAQAAGIQRVLLVDMHEVRSIYWVDPKKAEEQEEQESQMGLGIYGGGEMGMMDFGGMGEMGMFGMGLGAGRMIATPTPAEDLTASAAPVEIWVQGGNSSVMTFLYDLGNSVAPIELDRLRLLNVEGADDQVIAMAYFNVVAWVEKFGLLEVEDIERNVVQAKRELAEWALRPAVRDWAVEDGIVRREGNEYQLAEPTPTPYPTPEGGAKPTPPPPAGQPGEPLGEPAIPLLQ